MSLRDLVDGEALMDDDENDEGMDDYDGQGREGAENTNHYNDSSDEDDEDEDDEEAQRAVSLDWSFGMPNCALTYNRCDRFARVSLSTKMKRSRIASTAGAARAGNGAPPTKRNTSMKKISS
jgi:hypothetical protein